MIRLALYSLFCFCGFLYSSNNVGDVGPSRVAERSLVSIFSEGQVSDSDQGAAKSFLQILQGPESSSKFNFRGMNIKGEVTDRSLPEAVTVRFLRLKDSNRIQDKSLQAESAAARLLLFVASSLQRVNNNLASLHLTFRPGVEAPVIEYSVQPLNLRNMSRIKVLVSECFQRCFGAPALNASQVIRLQGDRVRCDSGCPSCGRVSFSNPRDWQNHVASCSNGKTT